jgi:hypothetical protein
MVIPVLIKEGDEKKIPLVARLTLLFSSLGTESFLFDLKNALAEPFFSDSFLVALANLSERFKKSQDDCAEQFRDHMVSLVTQVTATYSRITQGAEERISRSKDRSTAALIGVELPPTSHVLSRASISEKKTQLGKTWQKFLVQLNEWNVSYLTFNPFAPSSKPPMDLLQTRKWKLSSRENRFRMRMLLSKNTAFNEYATASQSKGVRYLFAF